MKQISDQVWVAEQLHAQAMTELANAGFSVVLNHRPDGEEPNQPLAYEIEKSASAAGIRAVHAPVRGIPDAAAVAITRELMDEMAPSEKMVMFCRSGMRSACAWALAERLNGADPTILRTAALTAGYDLSKLPL